MLTQICTLVYVLPLLSAQKFSPCPSIFAYEPRGSELDKWYGSITLSNPDELRGIWLRIQLDEPAELIGNWFGESSSDDNREFLIKNKNYHYYPSSEPLSVRFFVKFNTSKNTPSLVGITLNGRQVCETYAEITSSTTPRLFISRSNATTQHHTNSNNVNTYTRYTSPNNANGYTQYTNSNARRTTSRTTTTTEVVNDDDIFISDLSPRRPALTFSNNNINERPDHGTQQATCGIAKPGARPLITYGQATVENEWPWHVALYRYKGINIQYICGGTLISNGHVLTAAHCVTHPRTGATIKPDMFVVYLGKYNLYHLGVNVQNLQVERIISHPEYNATYFRNDIAVLKLERDVQITDSVRPICLWEGDESLDSILNSLGTVVGWGFDETGQVSENLMQAKMPIVNSETCIYSNRDFFSRFTSEKTYCAGFRNGTSACTGDSGGGMAFPKSGTQGHNTVWQLRGIVSLSSALQNDRVICDTSSYIVFTDVAKHINWIKDSIRELS